MRAPPPRGGGRRGADGEASYYLGASAAIELGAGDQQGQDGGIELGATSSAPASFVRDATHTHTHTTTRAPYHDDRADTAVIVATAARPLRAAVQL